MTLDLKRLCEAVRIVLMPDSSEDAEAIVRAVLMELREPSDSLEEACRGIVIAAGGDNWDIDYKADQMRAAMIDAILSDPVKA
jgi:hypothetical protein